VVSRHEQGPPIEFQTNGNDGAYGRRKTKRVVKNGHPTNELVLSASLDGNDDIFPKILELYVRPGSVVADITYGKGVFWRNVPPGAYKLRATDIQDGVIAANCHMRTVNWTVSCSILRICTRPAAPPTPLRTLHLKSTIETM
jgi:hypothetical protein